MQRSFSTALLCCCWQLGRESKGRSFLCITITAIFTPDTLTCTYAFSTAFWLGRTVRLKVQPVLAHSCTGPTSSNLQVTRTPKPI